MEQTIELHAQSLTSKFGFQDGDALDDLLDDAGMYYTKMPADAHLSFPHEVLARCVQKHLLPLIPRITVHRIGTIHNPIRTLDELTEAEAAVVVELTQDQVLDVARAVAAEMAAFQ